MLQFYIHSFRCVLFAVMLLNTNTISLLSEQQPNDVEISLNDTIVYLQNELNKKEQQLQECQQNAKAVLERVNIELHDSISARAASALMKEKAFETVAKARTMKENDVINTDTHLIIFLHGYNSNDLDVDYRLNAMDMTLGTRDVVCIAFNWKSIARLLGYGIDQNSALQSAPYLVEYIQALRKQHHFEKIDIIAHSMGNYLLIHALQNILNSKQSQLFYKSSIISVAADVEQNLYIETVEGFRDVVSQWVHYYNPLDAALLDSVAAHHGEHRAGLSELQSSFVSQIRFGGWSSIGSHQYIDSKQIQNDIRSALLGHILEEPVKKTINLHGVYSIHGYFNGNDEQYLSYHTSSGFCRQKYSNSLDSQFEFISFDKEEGLYYIVNRFDDKRKNYWLGVGERDTFKGTMVGLYDTQHRSLWKLVPVIDTHLTFKIVCYDDNAFNGWISYQNDGKWNKLYDDESDAASYTLELIQGTQKRLLQKGEL